MSVLDFLFEGRPPPSVTTYGSSTSNIPTWLSDYTQGLVARANTISAEPYQTYGGPRVAGFTTLQQTAQDKAGNLNSTWQPALDQAQSMVGSIGNKPGALATAKPFLDQAGGSYTDNVEKYMNPYMSNVIDRSTQLAQRALSEKLMPSINKNFIASGTYGSAAQQRAVGRGLRDITEGIQSNANAALADAYNSGANIYGQDMSRLLQAGQTAGTLAGTDLSTQLQAGQQLGALAEAQQSMAGKDIAAMSSAGAEQQSLNQKNLDLAYQDFNTQRNFPRDTVDWLSSVIRGIPYSSSTTTTNTGPANAYQPSPLSQIGSIFSLWKGISEAEPKARGGLAYAKYARGGQVRRLPAPRRGALETYRSIRNGR